MASEADVTMKRPIHSTEGTIVSTKKATPKGRSAIISIVWGKLDREDLDRVEQITVDRLLIFDCFAERDVYQFVVLDADHDVTLSLEQGIDSGFSHTAGQDTVAGRW